MRDVPGADLANVSPLLPVKLVFMSARKSVEAAAAAVGGAAAAAAAADACSTSNRRPGKAARILEMIKAPETFAIKLNYDF